MKALAIFEAPIEGLSLVEAGAGTGKTYNITSLYIRSIIEKQLMPASILVLTYTEAATSELKSRIRDRINECVVAYETKDDGGDNFLADLLKVLDEKSYIHLKKALYSFDDAVISTIHGFCHRLLKEEYLAFGIRPDFEILGSSTVLLDDCIDDFWHRFIATYSSGATKREVLNYLIVQKFNPESIRTYINPVVSKPYAQILPETIEIEACEQLFTELEKIFQAIKVSFKRDEEALVELIENKSGALKKNVYRDAAVAENLLQFSKWISQVSAPVNPFEKLVLFGAEKLQLNFKKGHETEVPDTSILIDEYLEQIASLAVVSASFVNTAIQEIIPAYNAKKKANNVLSYDDLIQLVSDGIANDYSGTLAQKIAEKYPVALVDEFQDTDPVQYHIFKSIYANADTGLFMIGDPKQAIYSFRGADLFTYLSAKSDASSDQRYSLDDNYRSSKSVIGGVNTLFQLNETPFLLENLDFRPAGYPERDKEPPKLLCNGAEETAIQFIEFDDDLKNKGEAEPILVGAVANEIHQLLSGAYTLDDKKVQASDIAVLVQNHRQAQNIQDALAELGLRSILKSKHSVFSSEEASDLEILLSAILAPSFEGLIRGALITSLIGYDAKALVQLNENEKQWADVVLKFSELLRTWKERGIQACLVEADSVFGIMERLAAFKNGERRVTNYNHLIELLATQESNFHSTPSSLLRNLRDKINEQTKDQEDELLRLESDEELIQISTMHSSKGLEYPIVFLPYLWESIKLTKPSVFQFHENNQTYLNIGGNLADPNQLLLHKKEEMAESIRLAYVALTRAKSANFIPFLEVNNAGYSSLSAITVGVEIVEEALTSKIINKGRPNIPSIADALHAIVEKSPHIEIRTPRESAPISLGKESKKEVSYIAQTQELQRDDLFSFPRMTSYSALTKHTSAPTVIEEDLDKIGFDFDEVEIPSTEEILPNPDEKTVFTFPKGADAGNFLHALFEEVEFDTQSNVDEVVSKELKRANIGDDWHQVVKQWVEKTLAHPLTSEKIILGNLTPAELIKEMAFYFPINGMLASDIFKIIREQDGEFETAVSLMYGFMKGFIDLTFYHGGKYYILDYKSNHLGSSYQNYGHDELAKEIQSASYDVQYHVYTVALHRFLKSRLPNYSYEQDFGGVIYLFLRGLNDEDTTQGVFYDCPSFEKIAQLDALFKNGRED